MIKRHVQSVSPVLGIVLAVIWLLLNQSVSPGHVALGLFTGFVIAWVVSTLRPVQARLRRLDLAAMLVLIVFHDIIRSTLAVGRLVLGPGTSRRLHSGFLDIPLDMRDPHGLAGLAMIITSTPGTVWVGLSPSGDTLTLHVLDLQNEAAWIHLVKHRYERRLMRIFE